MYLMNWLRSTDEIIQEQINVLEKLKTSEEISLGSQKIKIFDFNDIINKVRRERKKKLDNKKWKNFVTYHEANKLDKLKNLKNTCNSCEEKTTVVKSVNHFDRFAYLEQADSIFLDSFLTPKTVNNVKSYNFDRRIEPYQDSRTKHKLNQLLLDSELACILKNVKRERKKIKDEENWKLFNEEVKKQKDKCLNLENILVDPLLPNENHSPHQNINMHLYYEKPVNFLIADNEITPCNKPDTKEELNVELGSNYDIHLEIISLLNNINALIKSGRNHISPETNMEEMINDALDFGNKLIRDFPLTTQHQWYKLRETSCESSKIRKDSSTARFIDKLKDDIKKFYFALHEIENQLKINVVIYPLKELLYSFFNQSYSLFVLYNYFNENTDYLKDIENLLIVTLQLLHTTEETLIIKENEISQQEAKDPLDSENPSLNAPSWAKESVALARIKFGPPDGSRNPKAPINLLIVDEERVSDKSSRSSKNEFMITTKTVPNQHLVQRVESKESNYYSKKILGPPFTKVNGMKQADKSNKKEAFNNSDILECQVEDKNKPGSKNLTDEEYLSKMIAKRIQEIPGVDGELRKVEDIRIKMMSILLNIKIFISKNSDISSLPVDEDFERIQQRTIEFVARFKRNYFYRTKCQLTELKSMEINPLLINKKSKVITIIQKLSAAHQGILQSLQVIEKQLQTISVFGLTQEDFFVFYHYIYELTFMLKPFYGFKNTQVLDDVENLVVDTIKFLRELKFEQERAKTGRPKKPSETKFKARKLLKESKLLKKEKLTARKKSPYANKLVKKQSTQSVGKIEEKIEDNKEDKALNFMMNIKQRPGAEVRVRHRVNYNNQEPKTMVEILAEDELIAEEPLVVPLSLSQEIKLEETQLTDDALLQMKIPEKNEEFPKNVKLITVKRIESSHEIEATSDRETREINSWKDLIKYKEEFKTYKKTNPLYNKKSLQTVRSMTEKLMEEALSDSLNKVLNTINLQDLSALKAIMEEEIK